MKAIYWVGIAAVGGYFAYKYGNLALAGNDLNISFSSVDLSNFPNIGVVLACQNVSSSPIQVNALVGNVSVNGTALGNITTFTPQTIAPQASTNVSLTFSPSLLNLPTAIIDVIQNQSGTLAFNVTGNVNVTGIPAPLPFNVTQNFSV